MPASSPSDFSLLPFFESSHDLFCIAGFDGYFKQVNPAVIDLLGYSWEELQAVPINQFVHPDDRDITQKHRGNLWEGKPLLRFENRYLSKDGKVIWLSWTSIPKTEEGLVYAIAKDITHVKEQEKQRNQLLADLTAANDCLKKLNYATSHDIRSPIGNLLSVLSMWNTSAITDPETLSFVELLNTTSQRLKESMDRHLEGLQANDPLYVDLTEINLRKAIDTVLDSVSRLLLDSNATVSIDLKDFSYVRFNYNYLESVLLNLLTNSLKYAHPDRAPEIRIASHRSGNKKIITFSDNGLGFDSEKHKDQVFGLRQTFHQHSDSRGIGLYLVHNHISSLGGTITVQSEVNVGTTFRIELHA
ncbi:PAS domain-containing sensor histidine kinase [Pelagicoccus sp. SDUM812005]|uniref:sensor histidine kinase n=1 Tax=Pelagicoccus sp. SDUM812005 TaxID=3041257 RepID=UPI0028105E4B|nr:PAS domain-containing sensor histidine kinase [Pelagicoccus sp. SDUM812005]MDQ8183701.1 PAS domain-containing sensor histidine kinase [Pelagicoccus sp. SDUM812005]